MTEDKKVIILSGGAGPEREVSLCSGAAITDALSRQFRVNSICLEADGLPGDFQAVASGEVVIFPALHGQYGEDGRLQAELDAMGIEYCGSDAESSELCIDKVRAKTVAESLGITVSKAIHFDGADVPLADAVIAELGASLVVKPADQGSSVGLYCTEHRSALGVALSQIHSGRWLIERRIKGRELTVGLLDGKAMGIVEIVSQSGTYDYKAKYTPGSTSYYCPADIGAQLTNTIQEQAEQLFAECGCRDFARIDFLLEEDCPYFLEVNTLPGLTATSLLPKSASAIGLDFEALAERLVKPAFARYDERRGKVRPTT